MSEVVNEVEGRTRIVMETCNFTWSIEKFSVICSIKTKEKTYLFGPAFTTVETSPKKWWALIDFHANENFIGIFLRRTSSDEFAQHVSYTLSIIGSDKIKYHTRNVIGALYDKKDFSWGFAKFIQREIFNEQKELLLPNDTLTVMYELKISKLDGIKSKLAGGTETINSSASIVLKATDCLESLIGDYNWLYENDIFSDFSVKVGEEELKVHKNILCARSSVFNSMLKCDMKENLTNSVEITDFDPPVVKTMLRYIYCGQVEDLTFERCVPLFSIADKYNLQDLKNMCSKYLIKNLNVDNICTVLVLADMHNDQVLMKAAKGMFCENAAAIQETEPWIELSKTMPHLAISMYQLVVSKKAET